MARPIAPRFEITVLKNKSSSDAAQVPASGASINFYRAGATVSADATVPALSLDVPVSIYDPGLIAWLDTVRVGIGPATLRVTGVAQSQLLLSNDSNAAVSLGIGTRLVPTNNRPDTYMDPLATISLGNWINVDPGTGRGSAYLSSDRVDYDVTIPGLDPILHIDGAGVVGRSDQSWSDVRDFGDLQAAINALPPEGGTVFVPRGTWTLSAGVTVNAPNVTIIGEQLNTVIRAGVPDAFDLITVNATNFQMRNLVLDGQAGQQDANGASCLVVAGTRSVGLQNVTITGAPRYGLYLKGPSLFIAEACHFSSNMGSGARIEWVGDPAPSATQFIACSFSQNGDRGCEASNVPLITFLGCTFDGNLGGPAPAQGNGVDAAGCVRIEVLSSFFMNSGGLQTLNQFILLSQCQASVVDGCSFDGGPYAGQGALQGAQFVGSNSSRISNCTGRGLVQYLVLFTSSFDCVELGNSEVGQTLPRISAGGVQRFIGLSRGAALAPESQDKDSLGAVANQNLPGALAWVHDPGQLLVLSETGWKQVTLFRNTPCPS